MTGSASMRWITFAAWLAFLYAGYKYWHVGDPLPRDATAATIESVPGVADHQSDAHAKTAAPRRRSMRLRSPIRTASRSTPPASRGKCGWAAFSSRLVRPFVGS